MNIKDMIKLFFSTRILFLTQPIYCSELSQDTPINPEGESDVTTQSVSLHRRENDAILLVHENCNNFTTDEINVVVSYYPEVKIICQSSGTVLIPIYTDDVENIPPPKPSSSILESLKTQKKFLFNEIGLISETNSTRFSLPISPCARVSGDARGVSEIEFSLRVLTASILKLTRTIPFFTMSVGVRTTWSRSMQLSYSTVCHFTSHPVRHIVEFSTVVTNERIRVVTFCPSQDPPIKYGDWNVVNRVRIMENTLFFSCVSERSVSGICGWTDEQVLRRLTTQARKKGSKQMF